MKAFASLLLAAVAVQATVLPRDDDASPNFASINAQPQPSVTGPSSTGSAAGVATQANTIANSQATASGSAAATATSSPNQKRNFCWCYNNQCWGWCPPKTTTTQPGWGQPGWGQPTSTSTPWGKPTTTSPPWGKPTTTSVWKTTSTPSKPTVTSSYVKPASCTSTPYTPYYPATSTVTPSYSGTVSSASSCPTQPEAGTYCGFINPEDPCAPQPDGYGNVPSPDTPDAFKNDPEWANDANGAAAPAGFDRVFTNLNGSVSAANYLGLTTLKSYDVNACASACECTEGCSAFNLYVERDPSQNPTNNDSTAPTVWGYNCPNPASMTSFKCTLWGGPISAADATNYGQNREGFQVVIAGSNGYNAQPSNPSCTPKPQPGWGNPHHCPGGGIGGGHHHMGGHFFPGPFDVRVCAAFAVAQTQKNKDACAPGGSYDAANYWNAYSLKRGGHFWGMFCVLFTDEPDSPDGSYTGGFEAGFDWEVDWSWSQSHSKADGSWDFGVKGN